MPVAYGRVLLFCRLRGLVLIRNTDPGVARFALYPVLIIWRVLFVIAKLSTYDGEGIYVVRFDVLLCKGKQNW